MMQSLSWVTTTRVILTEGAVTKDQIMEEKTTEVAMEWVMRRRHRMKMEERMTVKVTLAGQRPWQKSWGRKPLRTKAASW